MMDDPGFEPVKPSGKAEKTGPAIGNCPVCEASHVPMAAVSGIEVCSDCYRDDWVRKAIIRVAREEARTARPMRRMD